jgi:hypothetical protein
MMQPNKLYPHNSSCPCQLAYAQHQNRWWTTQLRIKTTCTTT